jgi:hypothetical protein
MMHRSSLALIKNKSKINLILEKNEIETITFFQQVDGDIFLKRIARKCQEIERISLAVTNESNLRMTFST